MNDKQMNNQALQDTVASEAVRPSSRRTPLVDIYESDTELVLLADLPGVSEEDLAIEVAGGILTLEAPLVAEPQQSAGSYYRQFKLPERFDFAAGEALLKDGVLTLTLPKAAESKPKKIAVKTLH